MQTQSIENPKKRSAGAKRHRGDDAVVTVCKAAGDPLRANILRTLAYDSFGVLELGEIFAMSQPAVSHHLKILAAAGLVSKRREGTSIFYQRSVGNAAWLNALFSALDDQAPTAALRRNIDRVYRARQKRSQAFFATQADALAQQKALICDPSVYADAVLGCVDDTSATVIEVGPGNGVLLEALARRCAEVVGIDLAGQMLDNARTAVADVANVRLIEDDFNALSAESAYDAVIAAMVLHHMPSPASFFRQAARVLEPGGQLIVAELCDHAFDWVKDLCGDVWLGFAPDQLSRWADQTGFVQTHQQFLAQRNGFRVQVVAYQLPQTIQDQGNLND